jgi:hypothetical protein
LRRETSRSGGAMSLDRPPTENFPRSPVSLPRRPGIDGDSRSGTSPEARHPPDGLPREPGTVRGPWPITRYRTIDPRSTDGRKHREKDGFAGKSCESFLRVTGVLLRRAVLPRAPYCVTKEGPGLCRLP